MEEFERRSYAQRLSVVVAPEMREALRTLAARHGRTVSEEVRAAIVDQLDEAGIDLTPAHGSDEDMEVPAA
jgi:plasmid stability protein